MLSAANREQIQITVGSFMEFMAKNVQGRRHTTNEMNFISPCTKKFHVSRNADTKRGITNSSFPRIGATIESCAVHEHFQIYDCIPRTTTPGRSDKLPFTSIHVNNQKIREWLLNRYAGLHLITLPTNYSQK